MPVAETVRGFSEIVEGKHDDLPERAFYMKGSIDQVGHGGEGEKDEGVERSGPSPGGRAEERRGEKERPPPSGS